MTIVAVDSTYPAAAKPTDSVAGLSGVLADAQTPTAHDLLSAYHGDTLAGAAARGYLIYGNATSKWARLAPGAANAFLRSDATDVAWSTGFLSVAADKTLTVQNSLTLSGTDGKALTLTGSLTVGADTSMTGGGMLALASFTLTVPATGTVALATGIAGGQTIYGGTAASDNLTLDSTSHATKGTVALQPSGGLVGIGVIPSELLHIQVAGAPVFLIRDHTANNDGTTVGKINFWGSTAAYDAANPTAQLKFIRAGAGAVGNVALGVRRGTTLYTTQYWYSSGGVWVGTTPVDVGANNLGVQGNILMADGAYIGQAAGPQVAFDDTNNYLVVTGCKVGIGTTIPGAALELWSDSSTLNQLRCFDTQTATQGVGGGIVLGGKFNSTNNNMTGYGFIYGIKENAINGDYASALLLETRVNGGANVEQMRVGSAGLVSVRRSLYVGSLAGADPGDDNIYIDGNCSALTFTDRTPMPASLAEAYAAVASVRRRLDGAGLDHLALHPSLQSLSPDGQLRGRNLSALVSAQAEVIRDLISRIRQLEAA